MLHNGESIPDCRESGHAERNGSAIPFRLAPTEFISRKSDRAQSDCRILVTAAHLDAFSHPMSDSHPAAGEAADLARLPRRGGRKLARRIAIAALSAGLFASSSATAQDIPVPMMSIPQAALNSSFDWSFSAGLDYSAGKYGAKCALSMSSLNCTTKGTTVFVIPATAMLQIERLRLQVTLPYVDIEGPGKFGGDLGIPIIVGPSSTDQKHRSGLGDISFGGAWIVSRETTLLPTIEVAGVVKLPTASNGLGTGKTDYSAQLNLYRKLLPGLTTFGSLGYQWIGELKTVNLQSGARASAGIDWNLSLASLGATLDYRQNSWAGAPDYFAFNPYLTWHLIGGMRVSLYGTIGLTHSSPGSGGGIRFSL